MVLIKPMGVAFMTLHGVRTQKTFAGTGTDLSFQFGISQTFSSSTIVNLGNLSQTVHAMTGRLMKRNRALILVTAGALTDSVLARHTLFTVTACKTLRSSWAWRARAYSYRPPA